ncbi:MAG: hypothetical protein KDI88_02640 [Gammaproteobacteria bacterium]|nr:hypothetical protein [Gammaproteobacteria bacterium]
MQADVGWIDILAMLGLFVTGFMMWVAWELVIGRKALALFLALGSFSITWWLGARLGWTSPGAILLIEIAVVLVLFRVRRRDDA